MRLVLQRVSQADVEIDGVVKSRISKGLLILLGIEETDSGEDVEWLTRKIAGMRIFNDDHGQMNLSVQDVGGELLVVSQFTLHASTRKGNRPGFTRAARPGVGIPLYKSFLLECEKYCPGNVKSGEFGADMQVSLINSGPVTIIMDSKSRDI